MAPYRLALCVLVAMACRVPAMATAEIDTHSGWTGDYMYSFGEPTTATYGQTITAPNETELDDFSFWLRHLDGEDVHFRAYVFSWDGGKASGDALYESPDRALAAGSSWTEFAFHTGGVAVEPGGKYVLVLSASKLFNGEPGAAAVAARFDGAYDGGSVAWANNGTNFGDLTSRSWDTMGYSGGRSDRPWDLAFTAGFGAPTSAPEPVSLVLIGAAAGAAALCRRRRR